MIKTLTNQITYNRLLRGTAKILRYDVFELNDDFLRDKISTELSLFYKNAKNTGAITDYKISIRDFDPARPHYVEVDIIVGLPAMIFTVYVHLNNVDSI